jgi:hypothetical protein
MTLVRLYRDELPLDRAASLIAAEEGSNIDPDAHKTGMADLIVSTPEGPLCKSLLPEAIAECIPRGVSAILGVRYRWEARLYLTALAKRGYRRVIIAAPLDKLDYALVTLGRLYTKVSVEAIPAELTPHYLEAVDLVLDTGVLPTLTAKHPGYYHLSFERPSRLLACIIGRWAAKALLSLEDVFVEAETAVKIAESLAGS